MTLLIVVLLLHHLGYVDFTHNVLESSFALAGTVILWIVHLNFATALHRDCNYHGCEYKDKKTTPIDYR